MLARLLRLLATSATRRPRLFLTLRRRRSETGLVRSRRLRPNPSPRPRTQRPWGRPAVTSQPQPSSPTRQKIRPKLSLASLNPQGGFRLARDSSPFTPTQFPPPRMRPQLRPIPVAPGRGAAARRSQLKVTHDRRDRRTRVFEEEFRTYDIDAPEVRALQRAMPQETFALVEGLMGRWQQAGIPLRPARRGFAFQAPHGDRLTTVAWVYAPDRRHPVARLEVALDLLLRRGVDSEQIDGLRDDLTRFPTHVPSESESLVELPLTVELGGADMERLASALVQFGLSLA